MQISHVVLNYFFISYIIVVFLFILHIDSWDWKKVLLLVFFLKIWTLSRKRSLGSREVSKQFWSSLKSPAVKFHLIFFIFPIKLSSCLVLRKSLCLMTESVLLEWNLNFYLTFWRCHFTLKKFECLNLCFHHYIGQ